MPALGKCASQGAGVKHTQLNILLKRALRECGIVAAVDSFV